MECWYAWNRDAETLMKCASGGIFAALARRTIEGGGVVFGACFSGDGFGVEHRGVETLDELEPLYGSKYAQSMVGSAYKDVASCLSTGRQALFSGTPCQAAALKNYLEMKNIKQERLTTVEVLCHGITNHRVVERYAESISRKRGRRVTGLRFRTKQRPWYSKGSSMCLRYEDGSEEIIDHLLDLFYMVYVNNVVLRPSCYHCPFARLKGRAADYTIGDFWGAEESVRDPEALRRGIGLVLVNTPKASQIWNDLLSGGVVAAERLDIDLAIPRNGALVEPAKCHPFREAFFERVFSDDFAALVESGFGDMIQKNRIKNWIGYDNVRLLQRLRRRLTGGGA